MYADTQRRSIITQSANLEQKAEQQILEHMKEALRVVVEWRAPLVSLNRKQASVRKTLKDFCYHLEQLMDFEEEDGYLSGVTAVRPNWYERMSQLRKDHQDLRQRISQLVPKVNETLSWSVETFDRTCSDISDLLDQVDRHDRNEIALLQESMINDVGGEG